jgi:hypothetical protein
MTILLRRLIVASHRIDPRSPLCVCSQVEPGMSIEHVLSSAAMSLMPPTPVRLVPGLLQARGLAIGMKRLREALNSGVIPGTYDQGHWTLTAEDVDAAERYFREIAAMGGNKGGATAVRQAKVRQRASETP